MIRDSTGTGIVISWLCTLVCMQFRGNSIFGYLCLGVHSKTSRNKMGIFLFVVFDILSDKLTNSVEREESLQRQALVRGCEGSQRSM